MGQAGAVGVEVGRTLAYCSRRTKETSMVDMGILVGDIRRLGLVGPPYEVIGPAVQLI